MSADHPAESDPRLRAVHRLWATYREAGPEVAAELLHPDCEFITVDGQVYTGPEQVRGFFAGFTERGESFRASPFTFELHPPDVLVVGHRRIAGPDSAIRGAYLYFLHGMRDGKICRLSAHASREDAIADVERRRQTGEA